MNHLIQFKASNKQNCILTQEPTNDQTTNDIQPSSTFNYDYEGVADENVLSIHNKQTTWVSFFDQPGIDEEIDDPIANDYLDSSELCCSSHDEVLK